MEHKFPLEVSTGKTGLPFQEFHFFRKSSSGTNRKIMLHLQPNRNFRNFLVNGKRPCHQSETTPWSPQCHSNNVLQTVWQVVYPLSNSETHGELYGQGHLTCFLHITGARNVEGILCGDEWRNMFLSSSIKQLDHELEISIAYLCALVNYHA